jgi:DHA1 family bicyclomycin/chloramphenicol resistance-like MFS transporter
LNQPLTTDTDSETTPAPAHMIWFVGALIAIGPLSLDAYLPAMPAMAETFGVPIVALNNTISVYLVGYGISQFLGGTFSDQIGRKRIGLIGLAIFITASVAISFAQTIEQVQWLRFTQAFGGGFSTVICMAIARDVFPLRELGRRMAMITLIMLASPVIAPALGAALLQFGWPSIFLFKASYAVLLFIYYWLRVPETRPGHWRNLSIVNLLQQSAEVVTRRIEGRRLPMRFAISMALASGVFMTFLTNSSFAYIEFFGVSANAFPLYFSLSLVGLIATNIYSMNRLTPAKAPMFFRYGLIVQAIAVIGLVVLVFVGSPSIWTVVVPVMILVACFGLTGPAGSSQYMGFFEKLAGSASSFYTTLMFAMGAILGGISGYFFDGTLRPMALTMLCASLGAVLLGATIRRTDDSGSN